MNIFKRIFHKLGSIGKNVAYNEDRTINSAFGANPQETISSEIGRHEKCPVDRIAAKALDAIQHDHVEAAVIHANALRAADDGREQ